MTPELKHAMAFMNCPWKSTAGCNYICETCMGSGCPNKNVEVYYCDKCGKEIDGDVYEVDGDDVCEMCLHEKFRKAI